MAPFEQYYRNFEGLPQAHQVSTTFTPTIGEVFETLDIEDIDMTPPHSMIEPIVKQTFGSTSNIRMAKISVNTPTQELFKIINTYIIKDPGPHQSHT